MNFWKQRSAIISCTRCLLKQKLTIWILRRTVRLMCWSHRFITWVIICTRWKFAQSTRGLTSASALRGFYVIWSVLRAAAAWKQRTPRDINTPVPAFGRAGADLTRPLIPLISFDGGHPRSGRGRPSERRNTTESETVTGSNAQRPSLLYPGNGHTYFFLSIVWRRQGF